MLINLTLRERCFGVTYVALYFALYALIQDERDGFQGKSQELKKEADAQSEH